MKVEKQWDGAIRGVFVSHVATLKNLTWKNITLDYILAMIRIKHSSSSALQHLQLHLHREVASFPYKIQHVDHDGVRRLHEYERAGCEFHNNCEEHNTLK